jgi:hypothetical protein
MRVIGVFVVLAIILDAIGLGICSIVERFSVGGSLFVFLGLFVVNFVIAWNLAVFLTEKYLVSDTQRRANEEHIRRLNLNFSAARR